MWIQRGIYTAFIFRFNLMQKRELKKKKIQANGRWKWISETWLDLLHLRIRFREIDMLMERSLEQIFWEESGARMAGGFPSAPEIGGISSLENRMEFKLSVRENPNIFRNFTPWGDDEITILSLSNEGFVLVKGLFHFLGELRSGTFGLDHPCHDWGG